MLYTDWATRKRKLDDPIPMCGTCHEKRAMIHKYALAPGLSEEDLCEDCAERLVGLLLEALFDYFEYNEEEAWVKPPGFFTGKFWVNIQRIWR